MARPSKPKPVQKSLAARPPAAPAPSSGVATSPAPSAAAREPVTPGGGTGVTGGMGAASGGAQALYAPRPEIPANLRGSPLNTVAVARFTVAADGSATVLLVKPTPYPELNYLLLRTLRQWRFFPAVAGGQPVASSFEVRIPVVVE